MTSVYALGALLPYLTASARYAGSRVSVIWCDKQSLGDSCRCFYKMEPMCPAIMTERNTKFDILTALLLRAQNL